MNERITTLLASLLDEATASTELAGLDDTQIASVDAELLAAYQQVRAGEIDDVASDDLATLSKLRDARLAVCGEAARRYEAAAALATEAAERETQALAIDAEMAADEGDPDPEPDPEPEEDPEAEEDPAPDPNPEAAAEVVEEAEAITANAAVAPVRVPRPTLADLANATRPAAATPSPAVRTRGRWESLNGQSVSLEDAAARIIEARENLVDVSPGISDRLTVCRVKAPRPDAEHLFADSSAYANKAKIDRVTEGALDPATWADPALAPIVASGGWCAPPQPRYDVFDVVNAGRPTRDGSPSVQMDRGAINIVRSDGIAGITTGATGAVNIWDAATDAVPAGATKGRQTMDCETIVTIELDAIVTRMRFGNFQSRAFPELVASDILNAAGRHARVAEGELLDDWIGQINMDLTEVSTYGTWRDLRVAISQGAAQMRSEQRTAPDAMIGVWLPGWITDAMVADVTRQQASGEMDALLTTREQAVQSLRSLNVNPRFYWDSPTSGTTQIWGPQTDGANLRNWPTVAQALLHFEGSLLFGDGGLLNVGIVRDATLNGTNDYELFSETFEAGIYLGLGAMNLSLTHCPNGESQVATDENNAICTAS